MIHRHQMSCAQFVDLADAFALDALDELEQRACSRHIMRSVPHAGCQEALAAAHAVMGHLAAGLPATVLPPQLWTSIEARLGGLGSGSSNAEWL